MSKIVWAVAVIFMMMASATLVAATESKGAASTESGAVNAVSGAAKPEGAVAEGSVGSQAVAGKNSEGREYLARAWGKYGPLNLNEGWSAYYRIYYTTIYGPFLGQPSVVDSLAVRYPQDIFTSYSLGRDAGYSTTRRFDARLYAHSGSLTNAYIDWVAIRG